MASDTDEQAMGEDEKWIRRKAWGARGVLKMEAKSGNGGHSVNVNAILQALIIAGIVWLLSSVNGLEKQGVKLETTINERGIQNGRDIQRIDATLTRLDQRLTAIEQSRGSGKSNP
jgi:hypothetical protein